MVCALSAPIIISYSCSNTKARGNRVVFGSNRYALFSFLNAGIIKCRFLSTSNQRTEWRLSDGMKFGFLDRLVPAGANEPLEDRRSHECRDNSHDDQHGEKPFGDDTALEPDVDDDEFHQSAGIHQRADSERLA